jgi:hypothetical protein
VRAGFLALSLSLSSSPSVPLTQTHTHTHSGFHVEWEIKREVAQALYEVCHHLISM